MSKASIKNRVVPHPQLGKNVIPSGAIVEVLGDKPTEDGYICVRFQNFNYMVKYNNLIIRKEVVDNG